MKPEAGKFYRSDAGEIWCCFRARDLVKDYGTHVQSYCIKIIDYRVQYFLDDHSFDDGGETACRLLAEVSPSDIPDWHAMGLCR